MQYSIHIMPRIPAINHCFGSLHGPPSEERPSVSVPVSEMMSFIFGEPNGSASNLILSEGHP